MNLKVYSDWYKVFEEIDTWEIGHTNENIILSMEAGTIDWTDGVAQRITKKLIDTVNKRLEKLNTFYNQRLAISFNPFDITNLLIIYRKELIFIKRLDSLSMLPEDLKSGLIKDIDEYAKKVQKSLEDSAKKDLSGELKRIVWSYRVDNI